MDIAFHYFAVKTLARLAEFSEEDAQAIAEMSEYVDDYTAYSYQRHRSIPDELKNPCYDVYMPGQNNQPNSGYNFNPCTTGFGSMFDYSVLTISNNQKNYVLPFHFLPLDIPGVNEGACAEEAHWHNGSPQDSLISEEMEDAKNEYIRTPEQERSNLLVKVGMLLHIYADTCAHQKFSGYARTSNQVNLVEVYENISGERKSLLPRFREKFLESQTGWPANAVSIGHAFAGEAPDCTFVSWKAQSREHTEQVIEFNNTDRFLLKSREILDYLRCLRGKEPLDASAWAPFEARMRSAFLFDPESRARGQSVFEALCAHWLSCFAQEPSAQGISYHYDAKKVFGGSELSTGLTAIDLPDPARTRFYSFVRYAQDHLLRLYGPRPRSGKTDLPDLVFSCSQSGENSRADCPSSPTEGVVTINGSRDLSQVVRFNDGGCVYEIRILQQGAGLFDWIIWVDAQGPSALGGSGYLTFIDESGDKYHLSIFRSARYSHTLRYNSPKPAIRQIIWSNWMI